MREYYVNRIKHYVYDDTTEVPASIKVIADWRDGQVGDWVQTDDGCVIQVLRKGKMLRKKGTQYYLGTCTGTFPVSKNMKMDSDRRPNIYSFSGYSTPEEVVQNRRELTANERLFIANLSEGMQPDEAYVRAFPTNNKRYARMKAVNLIKTERVFKAMKEELKPICDELGVSSTYVLRGIKDEADTAEKSDTRLKALFKLSDILDLEDKNASKVQQITGVQFQGFTDDMIDSAEVKELDK
tara:strand:- start:1475 stop:2194 length:720 start_codon:yes stop_codon:yes gene_type:complete